MSELATQPRAETLERWIGRRFGRLVVVAFDHKTPNFHLHWRCQCDCGNTTIASNTNLLSGRTTSCGCFHREFLESGQAARTHGMTGTPTYRAWGRLLQRHGADICPEWQEFAAFYADMGECPAKMCIARKDAGSPYQRGNCEWVSRQEAHRRGKRAVWLEWQGRRQTMREWADELGMSRQLLSLRLKSGWSVEKALATPVQRSAPQRE